MIYKLSRYNWLLLLDLFSTYVNKKIQSTGQVIPSMRTPIANSPQKWKKHQILSQTHLKNPHSHSTTSNFTMIIKPSNTQFTHLHSTSNPPIEIAFCKQNLSQSIKQSPIYTLTKLNSTISLTHYADSTTALSSKTGKHNWDFTFSNK